MVNFLKTKSAPPRRSAFILDKTSSLAKMKVVICFVKEEKRAFSKTYQGQA